MLRLTINAKLILLLSCLLISITTPAKAENINLIRQGTLREAVESNCSQRLPIAFKEFNEKTLFFDSVKTKSFKRKFQAINNAFKKTPPIVPMYDIMTTNDALRARLEKYTGPEEYSKNLNLFLKRCEDALNSYIQET